VRNQWTGERVMAFCPHYQAGECEAARACKKVMEPTNLALLRAEMENVRHLRYRSAHREAENARKVAWRASHRENAVKLQKRAYEMVKARDRHLFWKNGEWVWTKRKYRVTVPPLDDVKESAEVAE
jgi:DNA integrity scanning protein DisA with diadenylate cyclase activity